MNYVYFTYGYNSKYALIDGYTQRVWLMLGEEYLPILKRIQQIFFSKVPLLLVDISQLENYTPELIDNSVCLTWQIAGPGFDLLNSDVFSRSVSQTTFQFDKRYKFVNFAQYTELAYDRALDLQQQMLLFYQIIRFTQGQHVDKTAKLIAKSFLVNLTVSDVENSLLGLDDVDIGVQLTILRAIGKLYD